MPRFVIIRQAIFDELVTFTIEELELKNLEGGEESLIHHEIPHCPWACGIFKVEEDGCLTAVTTDWDTSD
jgi:hypothetical protein